jgi:hypothetical protein
MFPGIFSFVALFFYLLGGKIDNPYTLKRCGVGGGGGVVRIE